MRTVRPLSEGPHLEDMCIHGFEFDFFGYQVRNEVVLDTLVVERNRKKLLNFGCTQIHP